MKLNWPKLIFSTLILIGTCLLATGCGTGVFSIPVATSPNAAPSVLSLSPTFAIGGSASQTVTITGTGFQSSSTVTYNGSQHSATLISPQQLTVSLSQSDLATPGNYTVAVTNQAPGGGAASAIFQVWQRMTDSNSGMTFSMPIFGNSTVLTGDATQSQGGQIIPESYSSGSTTPTSGFGFDIDPNVQHLSLLQWFEANVDINGTLIAA